MNPTQAARSWRRMAIGSFLTLLSVALAWNAAALAIDSSGLDRGDSWPMIFGSVFSTLLFGSVPILISLVVAVAAGIGTVERADPPCRTLAAAGSSPCSSSRRRSSP